MSRRLYDVYLHEKLLTCTPRSGRARERIMEFVRSLASDPFQKGDYEDTDTAGHPLGVRLIGRHAVTFFVDHAAREVKIVNIEPADEA
jgi:hypothetical protein